MSTFIYRIVLVNKHDDHEKCTYIVDAPSIDDALEEICFDEDEEHYQYDVLGINTSGPDWGIIAGYRGEGDTV